jgi:hypothetical protein
MSTADDSPEINVAAAGSSRALYFVFSVAAGLVAGGLTAICVSQADSAFMLPDRLGAVDNYSAPELQEEKAALELRISRSRPLFMGGVYGLLLGIACGLAAMLQGPRKLKRASSVKWIVVAAVLGTLGGAAGGRLSVFLSETWEGQVEVTREGMIRGALFLTTAALIGPCFGSSAALRFRTGVFAVLGAVLAAMVAPILTSLFFASSHSEHLLMVDLSANTAVFMLGSTLTALLLAVGNQNSGPQA